MVRLALDSGPIDQAFWPTLAAQAAAWLRARDLSPREAIVLLPHTGLLQPARQAFARAGGWQPRIETPSTLAASLGPEASASEGSLCGDAAADRLGAAMLLRRHAPTWLAHDRRAFGDAVSALLSTATALRVTAATRAPDERAAWWTGMREALPVIQGPGAAERFLSRIALEWAAASDPMPTDPLWGLQPAAWIAVAVGGDDALVRHLLEHARCPTLWVDASPAIDRPLDLAAPLPAPTVIRASGLEEEAQAAVVALLSSIDEGRTPVALIAQDRLVVRRIRALLERAGVTLADETGWALSTTRAGATVMSLLRAAMPDAGRDALLEAFKMEAPDQGAALEEAWRREREPPPAVQAAEQAFRERLREWAAPRERTLMSWLSELVAVVPRTIDRLAADGAGQRVLAAMRIDASSAPASWSTLANDTRLDLAGFIDWVDQVLEAGAFLPPGASEPQVLITPPSRAALRPFSAVVMPGCDERGLGATPPAPTLLPDAVALRFGVPRAEDLQNREALTFAQLLRAPHLHLLRRTHDGDEPLAASPLLQRAAIARRRLGEAPIDEREFAAPLARVIRHPLGRPSPVMKDDLPARLSASTVEALRDCPYRFFARAALGLAEADELDAELDKSDHGRWLHGVLHRFHSERQPDDDDFARLLEIADQETDRQLLDPASLWPYRASFDTFARLYLGWLHRHEQEGWRYVVGEVARRCAPPDLEGVALDGRLDRIDQRADGTAMVIDYKTGNAAKLKQRVGTPMEDTQLAVYAALLTDESHAQTPRAAYLSLSERDEPALIEHPDVARTTALLIDGLAGDLASLRQGAGATALGEGEVCTHCAMRGLCRRDHWTLNGP